MSQELWKPILDGTTALEKLQADLGFNTYSALHEWSVKNPGEFWSRAWDDINVIAEILFGHLPAIGIVGILVRAVVTNQVRDELQLFLHRGV